jgi:DNA-binding transcriptional ArsR family regulator
LPATGDELLGFFRAMADPSRLKIVGLLSQQSYAVEQLSALLGIGESTVSHHLSRLSDAGLVSARAEGHYNMYSLHEDALAAMAGRLLKADQLPALARGIDRASFDRKRRAAPETRIRGAASETRIRAAAQPARIRREAS